VFMNNVVQKMLVVIPITLSDWFLLSSLFVLCYRQHKNNAAYFPVISKNDVVCISGLQASPGGENGGCGEGAQSNLWGVRIKIQFISYLNAFRRTGNVAATESTRNSCVTSQ